MKKNARITFIMLALSSMMVLFNNMAGYTSPAVTQPLPENRFKVIWLEPFAINQNVVQRTNNVSTTHLNQLFQNYAQMGVDIVVIAYSEYYNYFTYPASQLLKNNYPSGTNEFKLAGGDYFLTAAFRAAEANNIKIIVGLSTFGNNGDTSKLLLYKMAAEYKSSQRYSTESLAELRRQVILNQIMASDIYNRYGSSRSFYGWYLVPEPHCLDVAKEYYKPVSEYITKIHADRTINDPIKTTKAIMISPNADAEICFGIKSANSADLITKYKNSINEMKNWGINIIAYQDSIGAAYQAGTAQFESYTGALLNTHTLYANAGNGVNHFGVDNTATGNLSQWRNSRLTYLQYITFPALKIAHEGTNVEFWINTELWRMDGNCGGLSNTYGCNYPGDNFKIQLNAWASVRPNKIMLNEGFTQFNFNEPNISLSNTGNHTGKPALINSNTFTNNYLQYLGFR